MLLSHSSKKCCIDADINYLGKAGKPFPTGIHLSFIIWFSHWGRLNTPVTACVLLMMMWPNLGNVQNQSECMSSAKGREEQSELLGRLRSCSFSSQKAAHWKFKVQAGTQGKEGVQGRASGPCCHPFTLHPLEEWCSCFAVPPRQPTSVGHRTFTAHCLC